MGKYRTRTHKAGLQRMVDTFVADVPDWIDVPETLQEIFRHQGVVQVLLGEHKGTDCCSKCGQGLMSTLVEEDQAELAIKVCNAAGILLDPIIRGEREMDPYSDKIQKNVLAFLMSCEPGIAWLALRNTWGHERVNRGRPSGMGVQFIRFGADYWLPIFIKIREDRIWDEG